MFVLAGDVPASDELEDAVREWVNVRGFEAVGVVRAGVDPDHVLPAALHRLNALMWHGHPLEIVSEISDAVLLDTEDRRIFISYARADGTLHADRIFEILTRSRFDVFLDRFHIPPGGDFIERIEDEIVDKSMVIVVETQAAARSHWVRQEVAIASKRGIGIAAVNLDRAPPTPSIDERARFRRGSTNQMQSFLLRQHRIQLAQRRKAIRDSVWHALCDAGADPTDLAQSALGFSLDVDGRRRVIGVSVRPADLYRFRVLNEEAQPDEAFLVHPQPALHRRRRDLAWLSDQSGIVEVDAGRIIDAAATMVAP